MIPERHRSGLRATTKLHYEGGDSPLSESLLRTDSAEGSGSPCRRNSSSCDRSTSPSTALSSSLRIRELNRRRSANPFATRRTASGSCFGPSATRATREIISTSFGVRFTPLMLCLYRGDETLPPQVLLSAEVALDEAASLTSATSAAWHVRLERPSPPSKLSTIDACQRLFGFSSHTQHGPPNQ